MFKAPLSRLLTLFLALQPALASAQQFPTVPAQTVIGRLGIPGDTGPSQAIPLTSFLPKVLNLFCSTPGAVPVYSSASGWVCSTVGASIFKFKTTTTNTNQTLSIQPPFALSDGVLLNIINDAGNLNKGLEIRASQILVTQGPLNLATATAQPGQFLNVGSTSWVGAYFPTLAPIYRGSDVVASSDGFQAITGLSRNSQAIIGYGIADGATGGGGGWAFYGEAHKLTSAALALGIEIAVVNRSTFVAMDPYNGAGPGLTIGQQLDCGDSYASSVFVYGKCSAALNIVQNTGAGQSGNPFDLGITFQVNSLSSTNTPMRAMSMTTGMGLLWYYGAAGIGTTLYSSVSGSASAQTLLFNDSGINYIDALASPRWAVSTTGSTTEALRWDDPGAAVGPSLVLFRASASPAASDFGGMLRFDGQNSAAAQVTYGSIESQITVATGGSERANLYLQTINGGQAILNQGLIVGNPTGGDKGIGTLNATGLYINNVAVTAAGITALTGDVTASGPGSAAATLATSQPAAHTWASAQTMSAALTYGGVTLSNSVTGTGSMVLSNSPTLVTPALGTPASGVATNLTGTASGLTSGNVTTNANLTGDVTSVGNATTLTNAPVIAKVLTGFTSGAGTVSAADSILSAFQKINGNDALKAPIAGPTFTGTVTIPSGAVLATPASVNLSNASSLPTTALTGALQAAQEPAHTGDVTNTAGSLALAIANNAVTLAKLATQATNTVLGNATSGSAVPTALAVGTCDTATKALQWTTNAGFVCNSSITAAAVPASGLTGATLAAGVTASSLTSFGSSPTIAGPTFTGAIAASGPFGAWTAFTPTIACFSGAGTPTSYTPTGRYYTLGKLTSFAIKVDIATNGACAGYISATLPNTSNNYVMMLGKDVANSVGAQGQIVNGTSLMIITKLSDGSYPAVSGSSIVVSGVYENQ